MFTGLIETLGNVQALVPVGPGVRIDVGAGFVASDAKIGDSIAVNGCCLTVVKVTGDVLSFEAGSETLSRTSLGRLVSGSRVNLERSLKVGDRLGGHYVSGHIDALGTLAEIRREGEWSFYYFRVPPDLKGQMASKGSIAVDGVSLTLVDVECGRFSVALIPHTLKATTLGELKISDPVNIETDILAKYVQSQLENPKLETRNPKP